MRAVACALRHWLWRTVCSLAGGLTVTGAWPGQLTAKRGCVLVANHSSHADTAAIMAALPVKARPVFAAAADYWFDVPVRRFLVTTIIGALPVRRDKGGTYAALLAAARPALARGATVVIYPEGTRTKDGTLGAFHSGAVHLAQDCAVPIIPVALLGTAQRLPKNGHFQPGPMEARIGTPVDATTTSATELREAVLQLQSSAPVRERRSAVWQAVAKVVGSRHSWLIALCLGFAEALSWPIIAEMALVLLAVALPERLWTWGGALTLGSVLGVLTTAWLAERGVLLPAPLTTAKMAANAYAQLAEGAHGMLQQAFSGVPVKVYARAAGEHHIALESLAVWTLIERGLRIAAMTIVLRWAARSAHLWLRRLYGPYLTIVALAFTGVLWGVIRAWS